MTSQINIHFATSKVKKANLTIDLYLWVYVPQDLRFWPTDPKCRGEFDSELRSGFRAQNGELKGSGALGSEGDNSPFRGTKPKLTSYSGFPYRKPRSTHFLEPKGVFGPILCRCAWDPGRVYNSEKITPYSKPLSKAQTCYIWLKRML